MKTMPEEEAVSEKVAEKPVKVKTESEEPKIETPRVQKV